MVNLSIMINKEIIHDQPINYTQQTKKLPSSVKHCKAAYNWLSARQENLPAYIIINKQATLTNFPSCYFEILSKIYTHHPLLSGIRASYRDFASPPCCCSLFVVVERDGILVAVGGIEVSS